MNHSEFKAITGELKLQIIILTVFVGGMWLLEIADFLFWHGRLNAYGIRPRTLIGLRGILFAPFLHGNFPHLIANTLPFISFAWLIMLDEIRYFWIVTSLTLFISGFGVWLIGESNSVHIGASGLIFGYFGFLLFRGLFSRRFLSLLLSLTVGVFYGSLIWGVLPVQPGVSWEGHLFGLVGGVITAKLLAESHS